MFARMLQASGLDFAALQGQAETLARAAVELRDMQSLIVKQQEAHSAALLNIINRLDAIEQLGNRLDAIEQLGNRLLVEPGAKEKAFANAQDLSAMDEAPLQEEIAPVDEHASAPGSNGGG
jgi:hypothetical protein